MLILLFEPRGSPNQMQLTRCTLPSDLRHEARGRVQTVFRLRLAPGASKFGPMTPVETLTFLAVSTPTIGAMNSGCNPLSISGGMIVSVIADAASYHQSSFSGMKELTGTMVLALMSYFVPSRASVLVKPISPTGMINIGSH